MRYNTDESGVPPMLETYERIKKMRKALGLSQQELAKRTGYGDRSSISKIEKGEVDISSSRVIAFAEALNTTPAYLMGWTDDPYDWGTDPDHRTETVPTAIWTELMQHHDDPSEAWKAWKAMEEDAMREAVRAPIVPPGFEPVPKMQKVPLIGNIACGQPITAEENLEGYVDAPALKQIDFALTCHGDSMIDAGIHNGDVVYIRKQPEVENGQIAAVRIGSEATLKRVYYYPEEGKIILQAANAAYPPMSYSGEELNEISIEGLLIGFTHWMKK